MHTMHSARLFIIPIASASRLFLLIRFVWQQLLLLLFCARSKFMGG